MTYGNYPNLGAIQKILVIKLRHYGDVLLSSPLFTVLKSALPSAMIDAYVYSDCLPMLEGHPAIHGYLLCEKSWRQLPLWARLAKEWQLLAQVRKHAYDLIIQLTEGDRGALACQFSGAKIRVGIDPQGNGIKGKRRMYTHMVKECNTPRHTVERDLDAVRRIGIVPDMDAQKLILFVPEEDRERVRVLTGGERYTVLHLVSRWRFKSFPITRAAELALRLHRQGERLVLSCGPQEDELEYCREVQQRASGVPFIDACGILSLKGLAALVEGAAGLICVDSVPLHMASAFGTPVVAIFGPSSEAKWGPWRHPAAQVVATPFSCRPCLMDGCGGSKRSECLYAVSVEEILAAHGAVVAASANLVTS